MPWRSRRSRWTGSMRVSSVIGGTARSVPSTVRNDGAVMMPRTDGAAPRSGEACGLGPQELPRPDDVALLGPDLADGDPERDAPVQARVRQADLAGPVDGIEEGLVQRIEPRLARGARVPRRGRWRESQADGRERHRRE